MKNIKESQVVSAEVTVGLFLIPAFRIIQKNMFPPESQIPTAAPSGLTRSLVCVWFASNVKFLLFKSDSHRLSLFAHSISRLVAFLALLGTCCKSYTIRGEQEQLAVLDVLLLSFFVVSSLIVMALGHSHSKESTRQLLIFMEPQRFFLQMDSFASLLVGLLWLMSPGWLLGPEIVRSEENLQLHLTHAFGAMMVGDSFASFATQSQLDTAEASVFSSRTVGTVMLLTLVLHNQLTASAWAGAHVSFGLLAAALWTVNSILGCLASKGGYTGTCAEKIYKQALQRKEKVRLLHRGVTLGGP